MTKPRALLPLPVLGGLVMSLLHAPLHALPLSQLDRLVIQEGGRKKPYPVFAEEAARSLSGKTSLSIGGEKLDAMGLVTGCWMNPGGQWLASDMILVSSLPLKKETGLDPSRKLFSHEELSRCAALAAKMRSAAETRRRDPRAKIPGTEKEAADVGMRLALLESLLSGEAFRIIPSGDDGPWVCLDPGTQGSLLASMREAWQSGSRPRFDAACRRLLELQENSGKLPPRWKLRLEVLYQKAHPFRWAWVLYALAGGFLLVRRGTGNGLPYRLAWLLAGTGFLLQAAGLASRVLIAGRPPVTNMYESVIWVAFGTVLFALFFECKERAGVFLLGAVPVAVTSLIFADIQPMVLDRAIHPLTPVLRDNFWLTIHVLTITLSYAAFALALGIAHVILGRLIAGRGTTPALHDDLYRVLQVGVLLLATGTILGGVWANYSWGRFWDWDPKETWALTALLGYLFLLHGRLTGLWGGFGLAVGSIVAFQGILMAWYGVNFLLGAGLHSYGFGSGGAPLVAVFVALEALFVWTAFLKRRSSRPPAREP
jgi:ABC-type transport system involved in cytochrome c biogenesis permease subunit